MKIIYYLISLIIGYLFGSIPNHKIQFKIKNTQLSIKKYFLYLIDILKVLISMYIVSILIKNYQLSVSFCGLGIFIGSTYSIFIKDNNDIDILPFVFLISLYLFTENDLFFTLLFPILFFIIIASLTKYYRLGVILMMVFESIITLLTNDFITNKIIILLITILIIYNYRKNIVYILRKEEDKISFLK